MHCQLTIQKQKEPRKKMQRDIDNSYLEKKHILVSGPVKQARVSGFTEPNETSNEENSEYRLRLTPWKVSGVDVADVSSDTRSTGDIVEGEARNERV
ncbi:hypothetical protein Hanom_Chr10g00938541 [Helianthus anomalus]